MKFSEAFESGADYLDTHDWQRGAIGDRDAGTPVCLAGSLPTEFRTDFWPQTCRYITSVFVATDLSEAKVWWRSTSPTFWNDCIAENKQQVIDVLRRAAKLAMEDED